MNEKKRVAVKILVAVRCVLLAVIVALLLLLHMQVQKPKKEQDLIEKLYLKILYLAEPEMYHLDENTERVLRLQGISDMLLYSCNSSRNQNYADDGLSYF